MNRRSAAFRYSLFNLSPIEPEKAYKYEIDLSSTSQVFKKGHRIRVTFTFSDFPHYVWNLNTDKDYHNT